jgi:CheY-like chemotaxis protein
MSEDLISLRMLIVSEAAPEREAVRAAATQASVPIQVEEVDAAADATAACTLLARDGAFDVVLFDSRMPRAERQKLLDATRDASGRPLAILVGAAEMKTREVLTDGLLVDGVIAKPIDTRELSQLIENCIRARLPKRVLIVDDSATVRSIIRKVLQASRFRLEPDEAAEGAAAIERANQQRFDIVFLDCNMPGLDGFATLSQLKRSHPTLTPTSEKREAHRGSRPRRRRCGLSVQAVLRQGHRRRAEPGVRPDASEMELTVPARAAGKPAIGAQYRC